ncbi:MAG: transcriptional regulator [Acidimicrobiales bacterium]|nr:MAG: transcriptional regulator [Acidimicrobiales bacterium]
MNPPPRSSIDRDRVLSEGIAFADEQGVDALSMRSLAERLGVGAMTLYGYVANKDELIAGMVDRAVLEIELPATDGNPREALSASAVSAHRLLLDHGWAATQWNESAPGPARTAYMESILRALSDWGLDDDLVFRGYHAVTMHIVGFTIQELGYRNPAGFDSLREAAEGFLDVMDADALPHLVEHIRGHLHGLDGVDPRHDSEFEFVLGLLLDGLANEQAKRG